MYLDCLEGTCVFPALEKGISEQVVESGILPVMAQILRRKSTLTTHTARLVAELARDGKNIFFYVP